MTAPAKKKRPKKRPKKPNLVRLREDLPKTHIVRQQALADFVTDPEGRDAAYHYGRKDREYARHVSLEGFLRWEKDDRWVVQRDAYWTEAQRQLLEKTRDQTVQVLADSMHTLNELRTYAMEWCDPIRDEDGEVLRYPMLDDRGEPHRYAGKPMLAIRPKSFEAGVAAALALDQAVQSRRDEILHLTGQGENASRPADPVSASVQLSSDDLRHIAQELTKRRQPELLTHAIEIEDNGDD